MGYFTWTLANKTPVKTRSGDYTVRSILRYGGYGAVVCPDDTLIKETCYEGYGIFDGKDVYDLVAEWNRPHLMDILKIPGFEQAGCFGDKEMKIYLAYAAHDDDALKAAIQDAAMDAPYLAKDWKRNIGIFIACTNNHLIPYPIKIVDCQRPKPYAKLRPSISTQ